MEQAETNVELLASDHPQIATGHRADRSCGDSKAPSADLSRRQLMGGLGFSMFGLGLPGFLQARAEAADRPSARARSCIFIFLGGGPSHLDIWDMKPQAPTEVRGEFQPIATSVPGIELTEHLPLLAKQAHHLAVLRALEMPGVINTHHWGFYYLHTGHPPEAARTALQGGTSYPLPDDWPFLDSVVAAKLPPPKDLPPAVCCNRSAVLANDRDLQTPLRPE